LIELPVMIRELRRALTEAMADGDGEAIRFDLGPIESKLSQADVQRITLTLQPKMAGTDRAPQISGGSVPGER
jgi:hypothetical protein